LRVHVKRDKCCVDTPAGAQKEKWKNFFEIILTDNHLIQRNSARDQLVLYPSGLQTDGKIFIRHDLIEAHISRY